MRVRRAVKTAYIEYSAVVLVTSSAGLCGLLRQTHVKLRRLLLCNGLGSGCRLRCGSRCGLLSHRLCNGLSMYYRLSHGLLSYWHHNRHNYGLHHRHLLTHHHGHLLHHRHLLTHHHRHLLHHRLHHGNGLNNRLLIYRLRCGLLHYYGTLCLRCGLLHYYGALRLRCRLLHYNATRPRITCIGVAYMQ